MKRGLFRAFESLWEEVGALQEEDGVAVKSLKYCRVDYELWVSNLSEFDGKSVRRGVEIERGSCNGLGGWHYK